jgi:hypothetical protein
MIEQFRRAIDGPMAQLLRHEQAMKSLLEPTVFRAAEAQRSLQRTLDSPARALFEQQKRLQDAFNEPMRKFLETQAMLERQLFGPMAAIVRTQDYLRYALPTLAKLDVDAQPEAGTDYLDPERWDEVAAWLSAWRDGLAALRPNRAQAVALLEAVCFLIAVLWFFQTLPDAGFIDGELETGLLLVGAGCLISKYTEDESG